MVFCLYQFEMDTENITYVTFAPEYCCIFPKQFNYTKIHKFYFFPLWKYMQNCMVLFYSVRHGNQIYL